jgi:hypothetical protein
VIIALIVIVIRFFLMPAPAGRYQTATAASATASMPSTPRTLKTTRGVVPMLLWRNVLTSKTAFGKEGAELKFGYGGSVEARRNGPGGERWYDDAGRPLGEQFRTIKGLTYSPGANPQDDPRAETYTFEKGRRGPARPTLGAPQGGAAQDDTRRANHSRDTRRVRAATPSRGGGRSGSGSRSGRSHNDVI